MKIKAFLIALLALLTLSAGAQEFRQVEGDPMKARIYTMPNGLKVYLSVNKETPRIQCYIAVRTGSRNDPPETTGLAHYLEHLMFKGTTHFGTSNLQAEQPYLDAIKAKYEYYRTLTDPKQRRLCYHQIDSLSQLAAKYNIPNEYDKMMSAIGAQGSDAYTSNDVTCYEEDIPANEVENYLKVQGDRFQNMVIRGFHTELEAVYEEYNMGLAQDIRKVYEALYAKLFPTHPYGTQTTIGKGEHLKNPSIVNIERYFRKYYVPNNVAICMAGDLDPDQVIALVNKYFGSWKASSSLSRPEYAPQAAITAPVDTTVVGQEAESVYLGWRFPAANTAACDTLDMIGEIMNNGHAGLIDLDLNQAMKIQGAFAGTDELNDYSVFMAGGQPKQGQSLEEVRQLLLGEFAKLRNGDFDDDLITSVVNNQKRQYYESLLRNQWRANQFVQAFINHIPWEQQAGWLNRISKLTKQDVVNFARKYFNDNYVCVYKRQGVDSTLRKVDKPEITPIPTNNDKHSEFLDEVVNAKVQPIKPVFADFKNSITKTTLGKTKIPELYVQNKQDGLFQLQLHYPQLGAQRNNKYGYAADYAGYVGTSTLTNAQLQQQFYKLACDYWISQNKDELTIQLKGLSENMPQALRLLSSVITDAQPDTAAYNRCVAAIEKNRADNKFGQEDNFSALSDYGMYGKYNSTLNVLSNKEMHETTAAQTLCYLHDIANHTPILLYFGPDNQSQLVSAFKGLGMFKKTRNRMPIYPEKPYKMQLPTQNEVLIAPYDAKNTYMIGYYNNNVQWTADRAPIIRLFNSYFGGGMNAIVFQELREARGLAYSAAASYRTPNKKGMPEYFNTYIITQNDKLPDCVKEFNNLIDTLPERAAAFDLAKQSILKRISTNRTTRFGILSYCWTLSKLGVDYDIDSLVYSKVPDITLQQLRDFEQTYVAGKPCRYIILGNEKDLDMNFISKMGPITRLKTEDFMPE